MASITVRVDDRVRVELEELAVSRGQTLSDLVRDTLEELLLPEDSRIRSEGAVVPRSLSPYERQMLAMQHRIMAHVIAGVGAGETVVSAAAAEGGPEDQRQRAEILEQGFVSEYRRVFCNVEPELSAAECGFVMDLLDMSRVISYSIERLRGAGEDVDPELEWLKFDGFDLREAEEARLLEYVHHLVDEDRWAEVLPVLGEDHDHGNTHSPRVERYRRVLTEYQALRRDQGPSWAVEDYLLSLDQLRRLRRASVHPSNRCRLGLE
ncbi:YfbU family protein [Arsenicicoccus dermatophilus]|uniref:YfbU family protein n=1 Tax=Arsenicicoccus dermatophilus TaxID=1076331 RepID=UPI001F4CF5FF|nr:YfbU family protein [Arsenicicoccus dermatophilus]MCH8614397.1 YfbU family protein [Arsenicicoccus dermatophilus]